MGLTPTEIKITTEANSVIKSALEINLCLTQCLLDVTEKMTYIISNPSVTLERIEELQRAGCFDDMLDIKQDLLKDIVGIRNHIASLDFLQRQVHDYERQTEKSDRKDLSK